jgi:hypothetical protein
MNKSGLFLLLFFFIGSIAFVGCSDDETCTDGVKNQDETGVDCGGTCSPCPTCTDGIQNGTETDVDCGGDDCAACLVGVHGEWLSSGTDIAPILINFASKIEATFNADGTYSVLQTDPNGGQITLSGVYVQTESSVDGIWEITLNQSAPSQLTAKGIFGIDGDNLTYEVAQIDPAITGVTAPTAAAGFGSTSGGAFGTANIQKYIRVN